MKRFLNILTVLALVVSLFAFGGCESTNRMSEVVIPRGEGQPPLRVVYIDHHRHRRTEEAGRHPEAH